MFKAGAHAVSGRPVERVSDVIDGPGATRLQTSPTERLSVRTAQTLDESQYPFKQTPSRVTAVSRHESSHLAKGTRLDVLDDGTIRPVIRIGRMHAVRTERWRVGPVIRRDDPLRRYAIAIVGP